MEFKFVNWIPIQLINNWIKIQLKRDGMQISEKILEIYSYDYGAGKKNKYIIKDAR
jgi:hypothetical protein